MSWSPAKKDTCQRRDHHRCWEAPFVPSPVRKLQNYGWMHGFRSSWDFSRAKRLLFVPTVSWTVFHTIESTQTSLCSLASPLARFSLALSLYFLSCVSKTGMDFPTRWLCRITGARRHHQTVLVRSRLNPCRWEL